MNSAINTIEIESVLTYENEGAKITIYRIKENDLFVVINFLTQKGLLCLNFEHAFLVFQKCIEQAKIQGLIVDSSFQC